ncbi:acetaldehyde dehydrogenase (acetylating) [Streptomyces somaliensis]|uniref:acetaldehyde dehydrogenase (acetylating) n=1 Tax=Streptomyces somaliensis TaxID=78355 RepID=UPI0020CC2067|nr:acetaldehyde dehydrogenase (acetylating) [Streptomyces somaliensis]MCP9946574.1 acetaldehyde dehydrogenase (acetylating) [Streptomyces somaliensis]MCP9960289.1 acetaldehyde dehydrogenase (acetylating) [Streptomyces somaliensis]MCP9973059.1 acetaldehyde dehydrogenase (acetylating) [Streptomyces somaliensis]
MSLAVDPGSARPDTAGPAAVAVIGTGAIGRDLVSKIDRSPALDCRLVAGRNPESEGLRYAERLGYPTSAGGIRAVLEAERPFDVVFDATSAASHREHWPLLEPLGTLVVDLTPSKIGRMVAPTVTGVSAAAGGNVNLISCGGQASVPVVHALAAAFPVTYVEVVSTVASDVAGRATRLNLDEYVATTGHAVTAFSGVTDVKAILNISPAVPPATFRTAVHARVADADAAAVRAVADAVAREVRSFAPGYEIAACTAVDDRVTITVQVTAHSDVLPPYAGNLDIINSAAVMVAEQYATRLDRLSGTGATR